MPADQAVYWIDRCPAAEPVAWARQTLRDAMASQGIDAQPARYWEPSRGTTLLTGTTSNWLVRRALALENVQVENRPEGVLFHTCATESGSVQVAAGTDERGLMYALLELADRIEDVGRVALDSTPPLVEYPERPIRGVDRFIMGPLDDEWFLSTDFWRRYLARIARCRFNRFVLVMGFDTAYFSPPYPFFVAVPDYPNVRAVDDDRRARNLAQLREIGSLCHAHGLEFVLGTWQQTPWTKQQEMLVTGLPEGEGALGTYCAAGLRELLAQCPQIDGMHFRVNHEAGIGDQNSNEAFWKECIRAVAEAEPKRTIDLRAKGLTDGMIAYALECGVDVRVPTKYWCEHMGLPHHLTQMRSEELARLHNLNHSRRYSYSDLLRKPRTYEMVFRLWNMGSSTVLLWGDPDYVRRFAESTTVGGSVGFEVTAPLSLKGGHAAAQRDPWRVMKAPLTDGEYEDDRYWMTYLLYGRIGYSSATDGEIWRRELRRRFGSDGAPLLERAYRAASKVLPLVTAFHMPVHPMLCYWPEMDTGGPLFAEHNHHPQRGKNTYQNAEPSDQGLFYKIDDYVRDSLGGALQGKHSPLHVRDWFRSFAAETRDALDASHGNREYASSRADFLMLADLADYHAWKIEAAVAFTSYEERGSQRDLRRAFTAAREALAHWRALAERGAEQYYDALDFSAGAGYERRGSWADRQHEIEKDVAKLAEMLGDEAESVGPAVAAPPLPPPTIALSVSVPDTCVAGRDLVLDARVADVPLSPASMTLHYRRMNQMDGAFRTAPMERTDRGFRGIVPGGEIGATFDLLVYFSAIDRQGQPALYPGVYHPDHAAPYFMITTVSA